MLDSPCASRSEKGSCVLMCKIGFCCDCSQLSAGRALTVDAATVHNVIVVSLLLWCLSVRQFSGFCAGTAKLLIIAACYSDINSAVFPAIRVAAVSTSPAAPELFSEARSAVVVGLFWLSLCCWWNGSIIEALFG